MNDVEAALTLFFAWGGFIVVTGIVLEVIMFAEPFINPKNYDILIAEFDAETQCVTWRLDNAKVSGDERSEESE